MNDQTRTAQTPTTAGLNALPMMETPFIAFVLAVIAGNMNGYTYYAAEIFSTVQSGNIILLGHKPSRKKTGRI